MLSVNSQANYVTVVEDRPIMSVKYCLPVPVFHFWLKLMHPWDFTIPTPMQDIMACTSQAPNMGCPGTAWTEESYTSEVQRLQKFCRRNCQVFAASCKVERQLTAESAECCRTWGSNHLPSTEAPTRTTTGKPDMPLWNWHALGWVDSGVHIVLAWYDHDVVCQWRWRSA